MAFRSRPAVEPLVFEPSEPLSLLRRWGAVLGLFALGLLTVPAAGPHGLATMVYVSATAVMMLPLRQGWMALVGLLALTEGSALLVDGWQNEASGDALGVWPTNCPELVDELVELTGLSADAPVRVEGVGEMRVADALSRHYEIARPSPN